MEKEEVQVFHPKKTAHWRKWLEQHHDEKGAVWLVFYTKTSGKQSITWREAVDVALCFGWIDSKKIKINKESSHQFFSKRKTNSTWSKINKQKVEVLIAEGLMTTAGYQSIETARRNGSWNILDEVEELLIPTDLEEELQTKPGSKDFFLSLSKSVRKAILQWIVLARKAETRQKRILEIAELAAQKQKPKHLQ